MCLVNLRRSEGGVPSTKVAEKLSATWHCFKDSRWRSRNIKPRVVGCWKRKADKARPVECLPCCSSAAQSRLHAFTSEPTHLSRNSPLVLALTPPSNRHWTTECNFAAKKLV